jgi:hypothetical protein
MAFALFYNMDDMASMAAQFNAAAIKNPDRNAGRTYWNNGLSNWQSAPRAPVEHPGYDNDPDMRIVVVANNTLAAFRQYLYALAAEYPVDCQFLAALADDMAFREGAVEPWPWVPTVPLPNPWADMIRQPAPDG